MSNENPQTRTMPIAERRTALEAIGAAFEEFPLEEIETQLARIAAEEPRVADEEPTNQERADHSRASEISLPAR